MPLFTIEATFTILNLLPALSHLSENELSTALKIIPRVFYHQIPARQQDVDWIQRREWI